tara:strand:- start:443 stop:1126 length:684 start_codon:yes stop_codon:yes gene_type:complete
MKKTLNIGSVDYENTGQKNNKVTIEIKLKDGNFSACGNVWDKRNYDIISGGQNLEEIGKLFPKNKQVKEIVKVWKKYHLNDMKPNCKHQTGKNWNASKDIKLYRFELHPDILEERNNIRKKAWEILKSGKLFQLDNFQTFISDLQTEIKTHRKTLPNSLGKYYRPKVKKYDWQKDHVETLKAGWTSQKEHKDGILSKPCNKCGYKYGSAWLKEEIPSNIINKIKSWN